MVAPMTSKKPFWLYAAPVIFLLLWSGGFSVAKLGIIHAEPLSFLAVRYASVCALLANVSAMAKNKAMIEIKIAIFLLVSPSPP